MDWLKVQELLEIAAGLPAGERDRYLDEVCAGDVELRREVVRLVDNLAAAGDFLEHPVLEITVPPWATGGEPGEERGRMVGPYRLERLIGRGGMGAVYLGVRADDEYHRRVAIKVLALGTEDDESLLRFRNERAGHTLQPTALAHEACIRMIEEGGLDAGDRAHFLAVASRVVRRVLVDHSRERGRLKRGGGRLRVELSDGALRVSALAPDLLDLDSALTELAGLDPAAARVVELKFFAGLTVHEIAAEMAISVATVTRKWTFARAWLYGTLASPAAGE